MPPLNINRNYMWGFQLSPTNLTLSDLERSSLRRLRFQSLIYWKGDCLGHMLLNINRKPYMESWTPLLHLNLSDPERSNSRSLRLQSLVSRKGAELGHMLLLKMNRKPCIESTIAPSYSTSSDLERSSVKVTTSEISKPYILKTSRVRPYATN